MTYEMPNGANMFVYCIDNPVNYVDTLGLWAVAIGGEGSLVCGFGLGGHSRLPLMTMGM